MPESLLQRVRNSNDARFRHGVLVCLVGLGFIVRIPSHDVCVRSVLDDVDEAFLWWSARPALSVAILRTVELQDLFMLSGSNLSSAIDIVDDSPRRAPSAPSQEALRTRPVAAAQ
jgi:hypothetical protein